MKFLLLLVLACGASAELSDRRSLLKKANNDAKNIVSRLDTLPADTGAAPASPSTAPAPTSDPFDVRLGGACTPSPPFDIKVNEGRGWTSQCAFGSLYCRANPNPASGSSGTCQEKAEGKPNDVCGNTLDDSPYFCNLIGAHPLTCTSGTCQPHRPEGTPCNPDGIPAQQCDDGLKCYLPTNKHYHLRFGFATGSRCASPTTIAIDNMSDVEYLEMKAKYLAKQAEDVALTAAALPLVPVVDQIMEAMFGPHR